MMMFYGAHISQLKNKNEKTSRNCYHSSCPNSGFILLSLKSGRAELSSKMLNKLASSAVRPEAFVLQNLINSHYDEASRILLTKANGRICQILRSWLLLSILDVVEWLEWHSQPFSSSFRSFFWPFLLDKKRRLGRIIRQCLSLLLDCLWPKNSAVMLALRHHHRRKAKMRKLSNYGEHNGRVEL